MNSAVSAAVPARGKPQSPRLPQQLRLEDEEVCTAKDNDKTDPFRQPKKFTSLSDVQEFFDAIHCPDFAAYLRRFE